MPTSTVFCTKCHKLAATVKRDNDKIEIMQGGKTLISMSSKSKGSNIGVRCPSGHTVTVEL